MRISPLIWPKSSDGAVDILPFIHVSMEEWGTLLILADALGFSGPDELVRAWANALRRGIIPLPGRGALPPPPAGRRVPPLPSNPARKDGADRTAPGESECSQDAA